MDLNEKTIDRTVIYNGKIVDVEIHTVILPNGETSTRELVYHNGAVAVCALTPKKEVVLVKQYRKPVEKPLLEIPAGKLEDDEDRVEAAKRELEEETGYIAKELTHVVDMYGSPGFCDEQLSIYFTDNVEEGTVHLDEDEFVEVIKVPIENVKSMLMNKEIEDAKTIIALQHLLLNYNHSK
ncbi:NUDIX hydrolase [Staphylococcus aureus]|nr:NUDIX hydrolase [Staphylococcus aureus]MBX8363816.1 NUDIX hydrolase [Staphylococcus aureus]HEK6347605.1 NUDIX hydrolase [Staphylococcus aureus]